MSKIRIRHHVNPLSARMLEARIERLPLPAGVEVEVEVGCADAQFLFERAEQARAEGMARLEVGLEIRRDLVAWVNDKAAARGLAVRAHFGNVNVGLGDTFEPGRIARFFVNFPDPCFKADQKKRRVMTDLLVDDLARALEPGGELFFQSDVWDLALDAMDVLERHDHQLQNLAGPWSFWKAQNPFGCRSKRESDCAELGRPVWRIRYRKRSAGPLSAR
jgi:tRNA (guanine-N7-)-methyltransferase